MFDQSFSSKCFQEIFDKENRKGMNIEKRFRNDFQETLLKLKELEYISKNIRNENDSDRKKILFNKKSEIKKGREKLLIDTLENIANNLHKHKIDLVAGEDYGGESYIFEEKVENFFISKKIQDNIKYTYDVKQSSRYSVLSEFINLLEDKFPKYVIRTDIKNFYESIPQKKLLDKINDDYLLSIKTKEYIKQIFNSYNALTNQKDENTNKGIPRGIGISAYLSELFMRKIDNKIRELDDVVYYARYVDDIIVVFIPTSKNIGEDKLKEYRQNIEKIILKENLEINTTKTKEYNLLNGGLTNIQINSSSSNFNPIEFLGYKIGSIIIYKSNGKIDRQEISIELSDKKIQKYNQKMKLAFDEFERKRKHNRKYAFKMLEARINYLTSNTRLKNNKDKVFVGIYYSNPFLKGKESLESLQKTLNSYIDKAGLSVVERDSLLMYNFISGFEKKIFRTHPFRNKKYKNYNNCKNDIHNKNNSGIIQFGITEINSIW